MSAANQHDDVGTSTQGSPNDLESPPTEICKHESLYFEHGNVVLLSLPEDRIITAFKLYKDVLFLHSPVFEGMLSIPSPPNAEEYDGVPLVHLHDKAVHLFSFLKALYEPMTFPKKRDFYLSFDIVESTFMLAKKYQCDKLLNWMCNTFSDIWPKDLPAWDNNFEPHYGTRFSFSKPITLPHLPEPCSAIRLAREYGIHSILPTAFYHLHCLSRPVLGHGQSPVKDHEGAAFDPTPEFAYLSPDDFARFVRGNLRLTKFMKRRAMKPPDSTLSSCKTKQCLEVLLKETDFIRNLDDFTCFDELLLLKIHIYKAQRYLCSACGAKHVAFLAEHRSEIWNSLPDFFGLATDA